MDFGGFIDIEAQSSVGRSYGYFLGRRASPFIRVVSVWVLYWIGLFFSFRGLIRKKKGDRERESQIGGGRCTFPLCFRGVHGDDCVVVGSIWNRETITTGKSVEKE